MSRSVLALRLRQAVMCGPDVPPGVRWGGTPAKPVRLWFRELTLLRKLAESKDLKLDQDDGSSGSGK
jgi:UDP-3-O-[3-hydroxymyristoyl] glucosamine N-acyltransferase